MADYNPRIMPEHEMSALINSIREFGIVEPVVVNQDNTVIGGHQRLLACLQLNKRFIPVLYVDLPKQKEKVLNLALNRIHGIWDEQKLLDILKEIDLEGNGDFDLTGFEKIELHNLEDKFLEDRPDADDIPEAPKVAESKLGEIYQLGKHRLMCGDATKREDVEKLMDGKKADMIFTDPPYGVDLDGSYRSGGKYWDKIQGDTFEEIENLLNCFLRNLLNFITDNCAMYICFASKTSHKLINSLEKNNIYFMPFLIWHKNNVPISWYRYHIDYEIICFCGNGAKPIGANSKWYGDNKQRTVWEINCESNNSFLHPTQKPIALIKKALLNSSRQNDNIADLFGGSGSTLIACEQTNRVCFMMEIEPIYCDVIRKRYQNFIEKSLEK